MSRKPCRVCGLFYCVKHKLKKSPSQWARDGRTAPHTKRVYSNSTPQEVERALAELRTLWAKPRKP